MDEIMKPGLEFVHDAIHGRDMHVIDLSMSFSTTASMAQPIDFQFVQKAAP